MSIRVLKLKSNNRAYINKVNRKKMLALSYVKKGCCPLIYSQKACGPVATTDKANPGNYILSDGETISYRKTTDRTNCVWTTPIGVKATITFTYFKSVGKGPNTTFNGQKIRGWDFLNIFSDRNRVTNWMGPEELTGRPSNKGDLGSFSGEFSDYPGDNKAYFPDGVTILANGSVEFKNVEAVQFISYLLWIEPGTGIDFSVKYTQVPHNNFKFDFSAEERAKMKIPIRKLSYHNYLKTAHNFKKNNNKCCDSNGKLVKRVKRLTYKRQSKTDSSLYIENKKSKALFCKFKSFRSCESACDSYEIVPGEVRAGNYILSDGETISYRQTTNKTNCVWTTPIGVKATITFTYFKSEGDGPNTTSGGQSIRGWDFLNIFSDRNLITNCFGPEKRNGGCVNAGDLGSFSGEFSDYPGVTILANGTVEFKNVEAVQFISDWFFIEPGAGIDFSVKYTEDLRKKEKKCIYNDINRGRLSCKNRNEIKGSKNKKVKTLDFVSGGDHIALKKANRKKANRTKYESDLMLNPLC